MSPPVGPRGVHSLRWAVDGDDGLRGPASGRGSIRRTAAIAFLAGSLGLTVSCSPSRSTETGLGQRDPAVADPVTDAIEAARSAGAVSEGGVVGYPGGETPTGGSGQSTVEGSVGETPAEDPATAPLAVDPELAAALEPAGEGDNGPAVKALQQRLDDLALAPGSIDGDYGDRTVASVAGFQELVGLAATGQADQATIDALLVYRYDGVVLRAGDEGPAVEALQQRLLDGPFDPGATDGDYGGQTIQAVWALEKLAGIPVDGDWGPLDELAWQRLAAGEIGRPTMSNDQRWVEVDLSEQLVKIYEPGQLAPTLVSHASSGSGIPWENAEHRGNSITPLGDFHIERRVDGWRESSLDIGRLYNPLYFRGGIALHGSLSVPLHPASHGCVRLPMHIAEYLPGELPDGTPVHVLE